MNTMLQVRAAPSGCSSTVGGYGSRAPLRGPGMTGAWVGGFSRRPTAGSRRTRRGRGWRRRGRRRLRGGRSWPCPSWHDLPSHAVDLATVRARTQGPPVKRRMSARFENRYQGVEIAPLGVIEGGFSISVAEPAICAADNEYPRRFDVARATVAENHGLEQRRPSKVVDEVDRCAGPHEGLDDGHVTEMGGGDQCGAVVAAGDELRAGAAVEEEGVRLARSSSTAAIVTASYRSSSRRDGLSPGGDKCGDRLGLALESRDVKGRPAATIAPVEVRLVTAEGYDFADVAPGGSGMNSPVGGHFRWGGRRLRETCARHGNRGHDGDGEARHHPVRLRKTLRRTPPGRGWRRRGRRRLRGGRSWPGPSWRVTFLPTRPAPAMCGPARGLSGPRRQGRRRKHPRGRRCPAGPASTAGP